MGWEEVVRKDLKEMGTSSYGIKREDVNRLGWRMRTRRCVGLRWLGPAVSSSIIRYGLQQIGFDCQPICIIFYVKLT